jgi:translation initiation factor 5B
MAKKDKKKGKQQDDYWDTEVQADAAAVEASPAPTEPAKGIEYAADPVMDHLADDFGGLMSTIKKSKGKKGKKQQVEMVDANEEPEAMDTSASNQVQPVAEPTEEEEKEDAGEFRVKTKKEKEKEKKEKEKAKKKAQVLLDQTWKLIFIRPRKRRLPPLRQRNLSLSQNPLLHSPSKRKRV